MTTPSIALFAAANQALINTTKAFIAYQNTLCSWTAPDGSVLIDTYSNILLAKQNWNN